MTTGHDRRRVVIAGTTCDEVANLLPFARVLAQASSEKTLVLGLVTVPEGESLSIGAHPAQRLRQELEAMTRGLDVRTIVRVSHHPWREAQIVVQREACDLLVVSWTSALPAEILRAMPCNVVVVNGTFPSEIRRILLPIRGGPYAAMALQVALAFAQTYNAEITLLHAVPAARLKDEAYREFLKPLRALSQITRWRTVRGDAVRAIVRTAKDQGHQLLVMGAIARPHSGDPPIGPTAMRVMKKVGTFCATLIVKTRREFQRQGLTISLGLPTLNEEKTIGKIVKTVRQALMYQYPLLDEIVVIDSNSSDNTVAIAQDLDVPVFRHPEILSQYGAYVGKGEALWKSLYLLKGDLIVWIDTDIVNIHPRFVYGIVGPLLKEPRLMYVKGFYQRPLRVGRKIEARGGGRVTELVARPLLNLFYPELSGMVQPLAGEYAGRRVALESVPFFTGYGVETGLLIDLLARFGLHAIGQVDLEERVHRNQSLLALSKMAFAILQVVMQRVGASHHIGLLNAMNESMKLIRYEPEQLRLDIQEIRDHERPPMISLPEYHHTS